MSRLGDVIREEVISIYLGANAIAGAVVTLGVSLTKEQIGAILVIGNVVLAPIVRAVTKENTVRTIESLAPLAPPAALPRPPAPFPPAS